MEQLLFKYKLKRYNPLDSTFKGKTECFNISEKMIINNLLQTQSTTVG